MDGKTCWKLSRLQWERYELLFVSKTKEKQDWALCVALLSNGPQCETINISKFKYFPLSFFKVMIFQFIDRSSILKDIKYVKQHSPSSLQSMVLL